MPLFFSNRKIKELTDKIEFLENIIEENEKFNALDSLSNDEVYTHTPKYIQELILENTEKYLNENNHVGISTSIDSPECNLIIIDEPIKKDIPKLNKYKFIFRKIKNENQYHHSIL